MKHSPARLALVAALLVTALLALGCGSDDQLSTDATPEVETATAVATLEPATGEVATTAVPATSEPLATATVEPTTVEDAEELGARVVSLSPTATEMLFAIGAGDTVVAADEFSNYPAAAPSIAGLSGYTPNVEAILDLDPDVVVSESPIEGLDALGVANLVLVAATTFDDVYRQMGELGTATGHEADAAAAVAAMQSDIEALRGQINQSDTPLTYYHELDPTYYTATSATFIGEVYKLLGLENIADKYDPDGAFFSYPQLTEEAIIADDPDLIFLADTICCNQSASSVAERPGWATMKAVQNGDVIPLDDDIASRWGPRIVDFIETVVAAINNAQAPAVN